MSSSSRSHVSAAGLYVHVPFCARACPYCDFDFAVNRQPDVDVYLAGLERERRRGAGHWSDRSFDTIYIGGGTPSTLGQIGLVRLIAWCRTAVPSAKLREITVELNPEHVDAKLVDALVGSGVTRVSLGIQSLGARGLRALGRAHDPAQATEAIEQCRGAKIQVSADLIVGWPSQTADEVVADVEALRQLDVDHVSVYGLTIEGNVPWHRLVRRGLRVYPDQDVQSDLLLTANARLIAEGFEHYEISNYARDGRVARHNEKYWTGADYWGLGPSAASARHDPSGTVLRQTNPRGVSNWLADDGTGVAEDRIVGSSAAAEALWLGLRRLQGVQLDSFARRFPELDRDWVDHRLTRQIARGNLVWTAFEGARAIALAPSRWLWHDEVGVDLLD